MPMNLKMTEPPEGQGIDEHQRVPLRNRKGGATWIKPATSAPSPCPPAVLLLLALLVGVALPAAAQTPVIATNLIRPDFWDVDGTVHSLLATNGVVYVGGSFSYVAPRGRKAGAFDAYTAERTREFPEISGNAVHALVPDDNGGWFLGGDFTRVGGLPRTNLVHLLADFSVDPVFQPNPDGAVRALVLDGATLYLGGNFTTVSGQSRQRLAGLNAVSGAATSWNPGANDSVSALHLAGGTLYVGGRFSTIGGVARSFLAALDPASDTALLWKPELDGEVLAMGVVDDRLIAGGNFNTAGTQRLARNGLAAFDLVAGEVVGNWDPNPRDGAGSGGKVTCLRVDCGTVYVGGFFTTIGGASRARVAAIDVFTGLATGWDAHLGLFRAGPLPSSIQSLALSGNTLFLGGEFNAAEGQARRDLIAVDLVSSRLLAWNPGVDGGVPALGVAGRTLLAAFATGPGGVERHNIAAFDETTGHALPWNPGANDAVLALGFSGTNVLAGGLFTEIGGLPRGRLAAIDAATGTVRVDWSANLNSNVQAIAVAEGRVFVGGRFTTANGVTRRGVAAFDAASGQLVNAWAPSISGGQVHALAADGGVLYVGGSFDQVNVTVRNRLAAIGTLSGALLGWDPDADDAVLSLAVSGGIVYAGGRFSALNGGLARGAVAALDPGTGQVTPWNPGATTPDPIPEVRALAVSGDVIYFGGNFLDLSGAARFGLGAARADGVLLGWSPGSSSANSINALAVSGSLVLAGGVQGQAFAGTPMRRALGAFPRIGAPGFITRPLDATAFVGGTVSFTAVASGAVPLFYQWRLNGVVLAGETNATITLTNVQVSSNGDYEITVSNALGTLTAEASLLVLDPARIVTQPLPQSVAPGVNVTLSVVAAGSPPPIYQWRLNGVLVPGAVYPSLTLTNVSPESGGRYSVLVANRDAGVASDSVDVTVSAPAQAFADAFTNRLAIPGAAGGVVRGGNVGATREEAIGEPHHAGKRGGASVWVKWIAPVSGVAVFSTRGSGFDTLLGIYTNVAAGAPALAGLVEVVSDEDRGGFLTSRAAFNARAGVEYQIAIDGLNGATGDIVLSWETQAGAVDLPVIAVPPVSQTVAAGGTATFSAGVVSPNPSTTRLQWYFGCLAVRGATNGTLTIPNVQARHAGFYRLTATDALGRTVESVPAALEIGSFLAGRSFEKLEDLLAAIPGGGPGAPGGGLAPAFAGAPLFLVSLGLPMAHTFTTSTNGQAVSVCGVPSGGAAFLAFTPSTSGVILVDTIGSDFDTVLSIYNYVDPLQLAANQLACDNNGAPDGVRSRLTRAVVGGRKYLARVGGVGSAGGSARIRWHLETPPSVTASGEVQSVAGGSSLRLDSGVVVSTNVATTYQWLFNGLKLPGATGPAIELVGFQNSMAGAYSVIVSNFAGMITNSRAVLQLCAPLGISEPRWTTDGKFTFSIAGEAGTAFTVQVAQRLSGGDGWRTAFTGVIGATRDPVNYLDPESSPGGTRFYRVLCGGP